MSFIFLLHRCRIGELLRQLFQHRLASNYSGALLLIELKGPSIFYFPVFPFCSYHFHLFNQPYLYLQAFVPFSGKSDATHSQPFEQAVAMVPQDDLKELLAERQPQPTFDKQDDVDVRWAQQSFLEAMLARGHDSPKQDDSDFSEQDDSDVRMAQKYFEEMLAEPTTTTTSLSFLSKFDRFDGQTCSLRKNEPLASYHSSAMSANIDPSLCARACLAVNDCSGFRIFQFRGLMYCDLMSTCTEDRLQMVSSKSLSTFLLRPVKDATRNPSFDYYYQYEATGGYFVPIMLMFAFATAFAVSSDFDFWSSFKSASGLTKIRV